MHLVVVGHATHTPTSLTILELKFNNKMKRDNLSICLVNTFFFISQVPLQLEATVTMAPKNGIYVKIVPRA